MAKKTKTQTTIERVAEFHEAFNQNDPAGVSIPQLTGEQITIMDLFFARQNAIARELLEAAQQYPEVRVAFLRLHLIQEELAELTSALLMNDKVATLDALTDLQYVLDGTYLQLGLAGLKESAFSEVHTSNMSKLGPDGKPMLNEAGRVLKGPSYFRPNLRQFFPDLVEQDALEAAEQKQAAQMADLSTEGQG